MERKKASIIESYQNNDPLSSWKQLNDDLNGLADDLLTALDHSKELFVGGGFGGHPSHQVMYRLNLQSKDLYFCVYDPSNVSFHETTNLPSGKLGYYPVWALTIPLPLNKAKLKQFLVALLELEILSKINDKQFVYNQNDLYSILHSAPTWLNGAVLSPEKLAKPILPQQSAICTWKAVDLWWQAIIEEHSSYRQVLLAYRLYCFDQIMRTPAIHKNLPEIKILLKRGLANMARMLDPHSKDLSQWCLTPKDKAFIAKQMHCWNVALKPTTPKVNQRVTIQLCSELSSLQLQPYLLFLNVQSTPTLTPSLTVKTIPTVRDTKNFDDRLSNLLELLKEPNLNEKIYIKGIEDFCYLTNILDQITLTQPVHELKQQEQLLNQLFAVLGYYQIYNPKINPHSVIIHLSLMTIIERLAKDKIFHFGQLGLSAFSWYGKDLSKLIHHLSHHAFLSTFNPKLDTLWERLWQFYGSEKSTQQPPLAHYCQIINEACPDEKQILQQHWEELSSSPKTAVELIQAIRTLFWDHSDCFWVFCYLNQEERKKIKEPLPQLDEAFKLQSTLEFFLVQCLDKIALTVYNDRVFPINWNQQGIHIATYPSFDYKLGEEAIRLEVRSILLSSKFSLKFVPQLERTPINEPLFANQCYHSQTIIYRHNPPVDNKYLLLDKVPSAADHLQALLYHLRISRETQVIFILSELINQPEWLTDDSFADYLILSLFQPGCLLATLRQHANVWGILEDLWQKNGNTNPAGKWFLLKLAGLISGYAIDAMEAGLLHLEEEEQRQAQEWQQQVLQAVTAQLQTVTCKSSEWHSWRLNILFRLYKHSFAQVEEDILRSYWFCSLNFHQLASKDAERTQDLLDEVGIALAAEGDRTIKSLPIVLEILKTLDLGFQLQEKDTVQVDLLQRLIVVDNALLGFLPQFIRQKPEYRELFGEQSILVKKRTAPLHHNVYDVYEWSSNAETYRALFCGATSDFILQKYEQNNWLTYAAPSQAIQQASKLSQKAFFMPPLLLQRAGCRVWVSEQGDWQMIHSKTKEVIYTSSAGRCYLGVPEHNIRCFFDGFGYAIPSIFLNFESAPFIHVLHTLQEGYVWQLVRYSLEFMQDEVPHSYQTRDKKYTVLFPSMNLFGTGLVLVDKSNGERFLIVPLQLYIQQKKDEPHPLTHYFLRHDLANEVMNDFLRQQSIVDIGWDYPDSERYVRFQLDDQDEPSAISAHDQIYLACLYLAQNRPKKALACLRHCFLTASFAEMERLWDIVAKLPAKDDIIIKNSRFLVVRLMALLLMMRIKKQNPSWHVRTTTMLKDPSNHTRYREDQRVKLMNFVDKLSTVIDECYTQYDIQRNNIPKEMRLTRTEERLILSYFWAECRSQGIQHYQNAIGARYLCYFPQETVPIVHDDSSIELTEQFASQSIVHYHLQYHDMKETPVFVEPEQWYVWLSYLNEQQKSYFALSVPTVAEKEQALAYLSPYMSPHLLLQYFAAYYYLACNTQDEAIRTAIKDFCELSIVCYKKRDDKQQKRNIIFVLISEILWTVVHAPPNPQSEYYFKVDPTWGLVFNKPLLLEKHSTIPALKAWHLTTVDTDKAVQLPLVEEQHLAPNDPVLMIKQNDAAFVSWSPFFKSLRCQQLAAIQPFVEQEAAIIKQLEELSCQLSLELQQQKLAALEQQFLSVQKEKEQTLQEIYNRLRKKYPLPISAKQFAQAKKNIKKKIHSTTNALEQMIRGRNASLIAD